MTKPTPQTRHRAGFCFARRLTWWQSARAVAPGRAGLDADQDGRPIAWGPASARAARVPAPGQAPEPGRAVAAIQPAGWPGGDPPELSHLAGPGLDADQDGRPIAWGLRSARVPAPGQAPAPDRAAARDPAHRLTRWRPAAAGLWRPLFPAPFPKRCMSVSRCFRPAAALVLVPISPAAPGQPAAHDPPQAPTRSRPAFCVLQFLHLERDTGLASRTNKAQQAERRNATSAFFMSSCCVRQHDPRISTPRHRAGVRVWRAVWGTREGAPDLRPVRQPARACLPLIGVEGGRF